MRTLNFHSIVNRMHCNTNHLLQFTHSLIECAVSVCLHKIRYESKDFSYKKYRYNCIFLSNTYLQLIGLIRKASLCKNYLHCKRKHYFLNCCPKIQKYEAKMLKPPSLFSIGIRRCRGTKVRKFKRIDHFNDQTSRTTSCQSTRKLVNIECDGTCRNNTPYPAFYRTDVIPSNSCCKPQRVEAKVIKMLCEDGTVLDHTVQKVRRCQCTACS